jgi:hypothetical protein
MDSGVLCRLPLSPAGSFNRVTAFTEHSDSLYCVVTPLRLICYSRQSAQTIPLCPDVSDSESIDSLLSCGSRLVVHSRPRGDLFLFDGNFEHVRNGVTHFSASFPLLAFSQEHKVFVYRLDSKIRISWLRTKKLALPPTSPIQGLAVCGSRVIVASGLSAFVWNDDSGTSSQFSSPLSFLLPVSATHVFGWSHATELAAWYNGEIAGQSAAIVVKDAPRGGCCLAEEVALASDGAVVFLAPSGLAGRIEVDSPIVGVWQNQFVIASRDEMSRVQVPTAELFSRQFDRLWRSDRRIEALQLVTTNEFGHWWFHVLKLFPFLRVSKSTESPIKSEPDWGFDHPLNLEFAKVLIGFNAEGVQRVIAQLFAVSGTFQSFAELFDSHRHIFDLVHKYGKITNNPSYLEYVKLKKLGNLEFDLCKSANDVVGYMRRYGVTKDGLAWLFERDPVVVYATFRDRETLDIVRDSFPDFYLGVLGAVVSGSCLREQFLEYGNGLLAILADFKRSATKFCECVIRNPGETDQNIRYEIAARLGKLLTMAGSHGSHPEINAFLRDWNGSDLSVVIWASAGEYERVEVILEDWAGDDFCAFEWAADRDPDFFVRLLPTLKRKAKVLNESIVRFLERNPGFLASDIWDWMDGAQPLAEIAEQLEALWANVQLGEGEEGEIGGGARREEVSGSAAQDEKNRRHRKNNMRPVRGARCGRRPPLLLRAAKTQAARACALSGAGFVSAHCTYRIIPFADEEDRSNDVARHMLAFAKFCESLSPNSHRTHNNSICGLCLLSTRPNSRLAGLVISRRFCQGVLFPGEGHLSA